MPVAPLTPRRAALRLARLAGLLPAFFVGATAGDEARRASAATSMRSTMPRRPRASPRARRLPVAVAEKAEIVAFRSAGDAGRACRADHRRARRPAAAGPAAQRMPDRRRARQPQMRLRAAARTPRSRRSRQRAGASCSICARKGAASGWSTSCAPMRCRTRGSTRSTPITGWASRSTRAISRVAARMLELLGQDEVRLLTNNPAQGRGARGGGHRRSSSACRSSCRRQPAQRALSRDQARPDAGTSSRRSGRQREDRGDLVEARRRYRCTPSARSRSA